MLDAYIIDAIQREEQQRQRELEQGRRLWLEIPPPLPEDESRIEDSQEEERGVIVIPLYSDPEEDAA